MLFDPARHEALQPMQWDEAKVRACIAWIADDAESKFTAQDWWPPHPHDVELRDGSRTPLTPLYFGACGVVWALHYLQDVGAVRLRRNYRDGALLADLLARNNAWLGDEATMHAGSFMMGELPIRLLEFAAQPRPDLADRMAELIVGNFEHPARELMWGSPGSLLAAYLLHLRTGDTRWANLFRSTATMLWSQLLWSDEFSCHYWTQDLYGSQSTYIDAVHGFVATALPLILGRALLAEGDWVAWQGCIENTVSRTASREGPHVNWRARLAPLPNKPLLMQYCHGAPGFVVCLADMPGHALDDLLVAAGEAIWAAGPLNKGSNLCHGTGGNGYAFLKLYARTRDVMWLQRARAFAMHGIAQTEAETLRHGQMRYSLWTGDPGFAIFLWDCLRGRAEFPTLDVFHGFAAA
ncbi:lanthionine synthetase C family protein [Pseudorhodoferax sp.]|uniref:lanthionine synthetase C family protein n=1 Tax=Pseudorhodoferax sp. TaxID=1993553 RepID=UPI002DD66BB1|nr:LanC-like protein [Pseudorhodoferax sp.]